MPNEQAITQNTLLNYNITFAEFHRVIKNLKTGKAPGPDGIRYEHLKHMPSHTNTIIISLFNAMLTTGHIPPCFKTAIITLILQIGKDPTSITAYKPITLAPALMKIFEKIIHNRLLGLAFKKSLLASQQTASLPQICQFSCELPNSASATC